MTESTPIPVTELAVLDADALETLTRTADVRMARVQTVDPDDADLMSIPPADFVVVFSPTTDEDRAALDARRRRGSRASHHRGLRRP